MHNLEKNPINRLLTLLRNAEHRFLIWL